MAGPPYLDTSSVHCQVTLSDYVTYDLIGHRSDAARDFSQS